MELAATVAEVPAHIRERLVLFYPRLSQMNQENKTEPTVGQIRKKPVCFHLGWKKILSWDLVGKIEALLGKKIKLN